MHFLLRFYGILLHLFPKMYWEEYGDEMKTVFNLSLENAIRAGRFQVVRVILRELVSLPEAVLFEHLRAWRNSRVTHGLDSYFDFAYGSWKEFLTALLPFFLTGAALPLLNSPVRLRLIPTTGPLGIGFQLAMQGLLVVLFLLFLVGLKTGMPRWSLPYAGFLSALLSVFSSFLLGPPIYLLFRDFRDRGWLIMDIIGDGIFWYGLLIAMISLIAATRVSPALERFRNDWTLLCFLLYGAVPFALWLTFDEYSGDEPYMLSAFIVLAAGAWLYLRNSRDEWKRFWALFAGLTLAMFIATVGKAVLVPSQDWPIIIDAGLAKSEAKSTVIMWGWFALTMLVPLATKFLPPSLASRQASPSER